MTFEKQTIFEFDSSHPSCHCSVIQELPNNQLMAVWYAGKSEAHKSVGLKASWKNLNENEWSAPKIIHKTPNKADGNEVIVYYKDKLHLFFNTIHGMFFPWTKVILKHKISEDFGQTWSEPKIILETKGYTVRTKPLVIGDRLIIPTGRETIRDSWSQMYITENGIDFHLSSEIHLPEGHNHQPAIARLKNGDLLAFLRTNQRRIYKTKSKDLGETWDIPVAMEFFNPNSALDIVKSKSGALILIWNNIPKKSGMGARKAIHLAYSTDEGKTLPIIKEIERDDVDGRFAYPAIIQGSDNLFHLTYTNRRKNISYVKFDEEWIIS
jgi:predicted neuraminidase